jgi:hypothetical protein
VESQEKIEYKICQNSKKGGVNNTKGGQDKGKPSEMV